MCTALVQVAASVDDGTSVLDRVLHCAHLGLQTCSQHCAHQRKPASLRHQSQRTEGIRPPAQAIQRRHVEGLRETDHVLGRCPSEGPVNEQCIELRVVHVRHLAAGAGPMAGQGADWTLRAWFTKGAFWVNFMLLYDAGVSCLGFVSRHVATTV